MKPSLRRVSEAMTAKLSPAMARMVLFAREYGHVPTDVQMDMVRRMHYKILAHSSTGWKNKRDTHPPLKAYGWNGCSFGTL